MKKHTALVPLTALIILTCVLGPIGAQTTKEMPALAVSNTSRAVGDGRYDWTVFVFGTRVTSDEVKCVEYTLHPTFPNPIRRVCVRGSDIQHAFPLSSNGWGEFTIAVRVFFRDGTQQRLSYPLKLSR
jgi:transcription initiation factor IIF auxiliary subunit